MKTFDELVEGIKELKERGFVKTHRSGNTGIGKTLEDLLGIEENNFPGPDGIITELKSGRKNSKSMLTLFTKSPDPYGINSELLKNFGYPGTNGKLHLHSTVNALEFNTLKGKTGFKISIEDKTIKILSEIKNLVPFWKKETLQKSFEKKYKELLYVKAISQGTGINEEFHFNEAWLMRGFDFQNFIKLLQIGDIKVDIRIGQYSDGRPHDHGTGFRIFPDKLDLCFSKRKRVV
ncbi:MAG: glycosyl hydrolase [Chloroflexi bacterium]|nr:glycosyl hydrolase [Chloroflexota bacterium]